MATPQRGIFKDGQRYLHALEYTLSNSAAVDVLNAAILAIQDLDCEAVFAFGPKFWQRLAPDHMPDGFMDFQPINGPRHQAPATQHDMLVWLHGPSRDVVMDGVLAIDAILSTVATRMLDVPGFVYHDSRDLTGFIDGSANPKDLEAKHTAALVPDPHPGAGGAFVLSQKWVHDLNAFKALDTPAQERVFGRTKADSIELEGDAMPSDSHVSRTDLKIDGVGQKMYRRSFPYGGAGEHGLYFLAFSCAQSRFDNVLASMYGLAQDSPSDHLLDFSTPRTGSYWFAPSTDDLEAVFKLPPQ